MGAEARRGVSGLPVVLSRSYLFVALLVASLVLLVWIGAACFGPRAFEQYSAGVGFTGAGLGLLAIIILFFRWLARQDLFAPWIAFPIAYVLWFAVGSIDVIGDPYPLPYGVIALGLGCYLVGAWLARTVWRQSASEALPSFQDDWSAHRLHVVLTITAVLALVSFVSIALQVGIPGLHTDVGEKRLELLKTGKSQFVFVCAAWTLIVFLATKLWTGNTARFDRAKIWFALMIVSLLVLSLGSRGTLLIPFVTVLVARHYMRQKTRILCLAALAFCGFTVSSLVGTAREIQVGQGMASGNLGVDPASFYSLYYYIRNTVTTLRDVVSEIPQHVPYQHGYLSFGAIASLLPGHHESSDMFFRRILGLDFIGFGQPATLLGPMYGDFGVGGVVVQMFGLGVLFVWLYFWMLRQPTALRIVIYAWICQITLIAIYGSLFTYAITLILPLGWLVLDKMLRKPVGPRRILFDQSNFVQG